MQKSNYDFQRDLGVDGNLHEGHMKKSVGRRFQHVVDHFTIWKITRIEVERKFNQNTFQIEFIQGSKGTNKRTRKALE